MDSDTRVRLRMALSDVLSSVGVKVISFQETKESKKRRRKGKTESLSFYNRLIVRNGGARYTFLVRVSDHYNRRTYQKVRHWDVNLVFDLEEFKKKSPKEKGEFLLPLVEEACVSLINKFKKTNTKQEKEKTAVKETHSEDSTSVTKVLKVLVKYLGINLKLDSIQQMLDSLTLINHDHHGVIITPSELKRQVGKFGSEFISKKKLKPAVKLGPSKFYRLSEFKDFLSWKIEMEKGQRTFSFKEEETGKTTKQFKSRIFVGLLLETIGEPVLVPWAPASKVRALALEKFPDQAHLLPKSESGLSHAIAEEAIRKAIRTESSPKTSSKV